MLQDCDEGMGLLHHVLCDPGPPSQPRGLRFLLCVMRVTPPITGLLWGLNDIMHAEHWALCLFCSSVEDGFLKFWDLLRVSLRSVHPVTSTEPSKPLRWGVGGGACIQEGVECLLGR